MEFELKRVLFLGPQLLHFAQRRRIFAFPRETVYFTADRAAHVWATFVLRKQQDVPVNGMDISIWVKSKLDVYVDCKITEKNSLKSLAFTNELFNNVKSFTFFWGDLKDMAKSGQMILEWTMRLKPKLVMDVYRNRPAFSFYRDIAFSDCQILPENPLCKAHQNVLAGASTWLRKHFRKKKEKSLHFKNYDRSTMEAAIKLMYTRKVDPNLDIKTMMNLLKFADDFKLKDKVGCFLTKK
uniref:BTB domain-containing protein n=1 Tax=Panagrolaimus sp. JU765 TaxID=591449 RepID=A0AC34PWW2_9BILA